ncbi:MAG TPA: class I SAM-dependent methyltransferase [Chthonomonadaceae bacterium]|nr:class I SAM-dependent methyltransferase [Chthonomonadaceae bacterium]
MRAAIRTRLWHPKYGPLLRNLYGLASELSVYGRWLALKALSLAVLGLCGQNRRTERAIISLGNRLFGSRLPLSMFTDYESYVTEYASSLEPYFALYDRRLWLEGCMVLDLGSGLGQYSALLLQHGARRVVSLEYQHEKALWARKRFGESPALAVTSGSAEALPFRAGSFDAVFSHTVFEHIGDVGSALKSVASVLKDDGVALIGYNYLHHRGGHHLFPYIHFPWATWIVSEAALCEYWSDRLAADQEKGLLGFYPQGCRVRSLSEGNEIHLNRLNFDQFEALVTEAGLHIVRQVPSEALGRCLPFLLRVPRLKYFLAGTIYYVLAKRPEPLIARGC